MDEVARVVLALDAPELTEEVMHFLDRSGRARVVGTAVDEAQLAAAIRQLEPDTVVASPSLAPRRGLLNGSALLALDTTQTVSSLRRTIRAGAAGFYLWPAEREELAVAAGRVGRSTASLGEPADVVAVHAGRGGIGTTFVATHLAAAITKLGRSCVLVDLDVAFADVTAALGVLTDEPVRTVADLAPLADELDPRHVETALWHHPGGFGVLLAPEVQAEPNRGWTGTYRAAIAATRRTCDTVVLHVPRGFDELTATGLELADRVLVVLALEVLSFRDAKRVVERAALGERCGFVVNRPRRSEVSLRDVDRVFGRPPIAVIPGDRGGVAAQDRGRLLPLRGRTGRALVRLAERIVKDEA